DGTTNAPAVKASAKVGQKIITTKLFAEKNDFFAKCTLILILAA
ncbi:hypothetical protein HMPREF9419_2404, partial [Prevotella nigrescens ATCC 33563]